MKTTVFALATPPGQSAIAIFRISGEAAHDVAHRMSGKSLAHRRAEPSVIYDESGEMLDDVVLLYFKAPHSSTGEDILEIHCHGSLAVIEAISSYLSRQPDLMPAEAGAFTKRAFDNGKMDLTEIEGLADLIESQTDSQRRQAISQLKGQMRKKAQEWREDIIRLAARLESLIDFADEELPDSLLSELDKLRQTLITSLSDTLDDERQGELIRNGVHVALIGPVNAGKSTALNGLAGRPAAIVADEAGTTRDIVEVRLNVSGVSVILKDTAGIRENAGHVESIGIERAREAANQSDLVIVVADGAQTDWHRHAEDICQTVTAPMIKIVNKSDKVKGQDYYDYQPLSLIEDDSIRQLETKLTEHCAPLNHSGKQIIITRARHRRLIQNALDALTSSKDYDFETSPEIVAEDMRLAADALGQMLGHIDVEDILSDIFSSFCIGK